MSGKRRMRASGGSVGTKEGVTDSTEAPKEVYSGKGSKVVKEADEKKHGGRVKRKHGGKVEHHKMEGHAAMRRLDRPGRKMGGRCGADTSPLSSAQGKAPAGRTLVSDEEGG